MNIKKREAKINTLQKQVSNITSEIASDPSVMYEIKKYNENVGYIISPKLATQLFDYLEEKEMMEDGELVESLILARKEAREEKGEGLEKVLEEIEKS